jgi:hypothetical protein
MQQPNKDKKTNRPDTPLASTPAPKMFNAVKEKLPSKSKTTQKVATGVRISPKDEKAHPEDFKYLKR